MSSKLIRKIFLVLGLALFGSILYREGWENIKNALLQIGWWWIGICALAIIWQISHTLAWHQILKFSAHRLPFLNLFKLKIIAEAVNMIAPTANIGGEMSRAYILKDEIPISDSISSVVVDKTLDNITKLLFNSIGLFVSVLFIPIPEAWIWGSVAYLIFALFVCIALVWVQLKGMTGWVSKVANWIPKVRDALEKQKEKLASLDGNFKSIYTKGLKNLTFATCFHLLGRTLGTVEIWLVMYLLGAPIGFLEAFFIATVVNIVMGALFLIPGQWGALEYVTLALVQLIGFTPTIGASLAIIRRIRRVAITGLGIAFFYFYGERKKIPTQPVKTVSNT
jgi:uncharacterized protein (TIRG00374 family)